MASIEVTNSHVDEVLNALQQKRRQVLIEWGITAEGYASDYCPVDTGRLRASISYDTDDDTMYLGTNVEYAPYVELGHAQEVGRFVPAIGKRLKSPYVAGTPFLRPAIENHLSEYKEIMNDIMTE